MDNKGTTTLTLVVGGFTGTMPPKEINYYCMESVLYQLKLTFCRIEVMFYHMKLMDVLL